MALSDRQIVQNITQLREVVDRWLIKHRLARDSYLKTFQEHFDSEPSEIPVALVLCYDNELYDVFSGYQEGSENLLSDLEDGLKPLAFCWELYDHTTVTFHPTNNEPDYYDYFRFQWLCSFIEPGMKDIAGEVFGYFGTTPSRLSEMPSRSLEVLLDAAFQAQGFRTELGPGSADGGVDIRLYQHDVIGEIQTLVQVKRYAKHRPIRLDAVAALRALISDQKANRGLFVTTSRYLRSVRRFSERQGRLIKIADSNDMIEWCDQAERSVNRGIDVTSLQALCLQLRGGLKSNGLVGKIAHANWGHNMTINDFVIVVREAPGSVLLAPIKSRVIKDDRYGQVGEELPEFTLNDKKDSPPAFLARKRENKSQFWGRGRLYSLWNGAPQYFNYMD
jgi:hypothetical protein